MNSRWLVLNTLLLFAVASAAATQTYKVEPIGPCTNPDLSDVVKSSLQSQGIRVSGESGTLYELWLRKVIPQKAGSSGADYGTIANGTFTGVISYAVRAGDFRGQAIKPGTYTMRYQTVPVDGNHMGVSPTPDYFLLLPPSADKDPDALIEYDNLVKLSIQAAGTRHPCPLYLIAPTAGGSAGFHQADEGHWAIEAKTKAKPAGAGAEIDFPIAIILIGRGEG